MLRWHLTNLEGLVGVWSTVGKYNVDKCSKTNFNKSLLKLVFEAEEQVSEKRIS